MFWLFKKNVDDNFKFNMKFLNYRKSMIDDEEIFVFENTNKLLNYDYNITCLVYIKENVVLELKKIYLMIVKYIMNMKKLIMIVFHML